MQSAIAPMATQAADNTTPLMRRDVIVRYGPTLPAVLNRVSTLLDTGTVHALDARVELAGAEPPAVGRQLAARTRADPGGG
jgi:hypothetical protein